MSVVVVVDFFICRKCGLVINMYKIGFYLINIKNVFMCVK